MSRPWLGPNQVAPPGWIFAHSVKSYARPSTIQNGRPRGRTVPV
jgi:hypothetical protein